jgi:TctA family transporter
MAKQGRAGPALGIAAFASFIAGTLGVIGLMLFAVPLAKVALEFGPPEYFGVLLLGLTLISYLSRGSMIKALMMALLFGALIMHGMRPGPLLLKDHPDLFWGVISSMYIGNIMLLIINLPLIPLWVKVLKIPYGILFPLILLFCLIGAYSLNNNTFDIFVMILFGVAGYLFKKFNYEAAPMILAFILGSMFELNLRQSLILSKGSFMIFFTRPISAVAVSFAIILFITSFFPYFIKRKKEYESSTRED